MQAKTEEQPIAEATPSDLAADMQHHRTTYRRFLRILAYSLAGVAVVLLILFIVYL